jgi:hypothetical protein
VKRNDTVGAEFVYGPFTADELPFANFSKQVTEFYKTKTGKTRFTFFVMPDGNKIIVYGPQDIVRQYINFSRKPVERIVLLSKHVVRVPV